MIRFRKIGFYFLHGVYYEILANQIRMMQMSFRFRCKGVVRKNVSHEVYYEILANQIQRMQMSFRFRCKGVVRNNVSHEVYYVNEV